MSHKLEILNVSELTHDVRRFRVEKPGGYEFRPGQATDVAIDVSGWRDEKRPFTFTSLPADPALEFTIKIYPDHDGVTEQLGRLEVGDNLLVDDPWGAITYSGPGYFIAGGAGVTPFVSIIRDQASSGTLNGHSLIFSNKTEGDIILRSEFENTEGLKCIFTVTDQPDSHLSGGQIDRTFLKKHVDDFGKNFYVCGPPPMVEDISKVLEDLGASPENITFED